MLMLVVIIKNSRYLKQRIFGKKGAEGIEYVILLLGALVFITLMFTYSLNMVIKQDKNPFFSQPGEREYYMLALYQAVYADLYKLDLFATYALSETVSDAALQYGNVKHSSCGTHLGYPIITDDNGYCPPPTDGMRTSVEENFEKNLYEHVIASDLDFPFRYDFSAIIDEPTTEMKILGNSFDTIKYSLNPNDVQQKLGATSQNKDLTYDLSTSCHYMAANKELAFSNGQLRDGFECSDSYCTGPCPGGLNIRAVPYYNQCHIAACDDGSCRIDQEEICQYGCFFKSLQMAYAFNNFYFDETRSLQTNDVLKLLVELSSVVPASIDRYPEGASDEVLPGKTINIKTDEDKNGNPIYKTILERIDASHYTQLVNMVAEGLVVIRLRKLNSCPIPDELGYCPYQHFVTVIAANDDFIVIHDPFTPNGNPSESGMNVVLSREYLKKVWTGRYVTIKSI